MRTTLIPVTVGIFEMRREHEGPKVTTVTRMEAFRRHKRPLRPIPLTVSTFEACLGGGGGDTIGEGGWERRAQDNK